MLLKVKPPVSEKKRILFIESYPHVMFGQQHTLLALLNKARDMGIEPVVAVTGPGVFTTAVEEQGFETHTFAYPELLSSYGGAIYGYKGLKAFTMAKQLLGYVADIRRQLKDLNIQAVFSNDMRGLLTAGVAARSLFLPVMIWDKLDKPHGWMDWVQLPLVKRNLIISEAVKTKYPGWQTAWFSKRIVKMYDGAVLQKFQQAVPIRSSLPINNDDRVLAIVGSITHRKGHDRILSVFPELADRFPDLKLLIVGDVSDPAEDSRFIESLPSLDHPNVIRTGWRRDIPEIMASIDILLLPSRQEGLGLVAAEAMACAKPVIGSNTGGIPEVIDHGNTGYVFDSETQLAEQITRLCQDAKLREKMGKAGLERARQFFDRERQMEKAVNELVSLIH